jgi:hypothetical protein
LKKAQIKGFLEYEGVEDDNELYAYVEDLGEWIGNLEIAVGQILGYLPKRNKMKPLLAALLITLSFNALAGDNIIQQQLKLQQNLMRIQQQNQQYLMPERHEERREQYQQPYYNQPYYGNGYYGNQGYYNQPYYGNQPYQGNQGYYDNSWSAWWNNLWN